MWHTNPPRDPEPVFEPPVLVQEPVYEYALRMNNGRLLDAVFYLEKLLARTHYGSEYSETERICALTAFQGDKSKGYYHAVSRMMHYEEMEQVYFKAGELERLKRPINTVPVFTRPWGIDKNDKYRCCGQGIESKGCWTSLLDNDENYQERPFLLWWDMDMTDIWRASTVDEMRQLMNSKFQVGTAFLKKSQIYPEILTLLPDAIRDCASFMFGTLRTNMLANSWRFPIDAFDDGITRQLYNAQFAFNEPFHTCKRVPATAAPLSWSAFLRESVFGQDAACSVFAVATPPTRIPPPSAGGASTNPPPPTNTPPSSGGSGGGAATNNAGGASTNPPPPTNTPPPSGGSGGGAATNAPPTRIPLKRDTITSFTSDPILTSELEWAFDLMDEFPGTKDQVMSLIDQFPNVAPFQVYRRTMIADLQGQWDSIPITWQSDYEKYYSMRKKADFIKLKEELLWDVVARWEIPPDLQNPPVPSAWPLKSKVARRILDTFHSFGTAISHWHVPNHGRAPQGRREQQVDRYFFNGSTDTIRITKAISDEWTEDYANAMFMLYALDQYILRSQGLITQEEADLEMDKAFFARGNP